MVCKNTSTFFFKAANSGVVKSQTAANGFLLNLTCEKTKKNINGFEIIKEYFYQNIHPFVKNAITVKPVITHTVIIHNL